MKSYLVQLGALALICGVLASCGGAEGVEQSPTASAKTAEKKPEKTAAKKSEDTPPKGESEIEQKAHEAIVLFKQTDPGMTKFFDESKGYVVFPKVAKGGQTGAPALSSWGDGGYFEVWVNSSNDWVYAPTHRAERAMVAAAGDFISADGLHRRTLDQCARQLMLAQGSDWPFLMYAGTAKTYATGRITDLLCRFEALMAQLRADKLDTELLGKYEWLDDAFPEMDYRVFYPLR